MKKTKKTLLSIFMAAATVVSSASSLCANATYTITTKPIDHSGYIKVDFMSDENTDFYIYAENDELSSYAARLVIRETKLNDTIYFNAANQNITPDMVNEIFSEFKTEHDDNVKVSTEIYDNDFRKSFKYYITPYDPEQKNTVLKFTSNDARRIKELLNNTADNITFANNVFVPEYGWGELTHFDFSSTFYADMIGGKYDNKQGEYERVLAKATENLNNYLADKNYDITVDTEQKISITPNNKDISLEEQLALLKELKENCGLIMNCSYDASTNESCNGIDIYNAVDGDANCDEAMNLADSVAIMQSIANPDKYQLSEQGKFNSDLNGDGITNNDALDIQKKLLGLE